MESISLKANAKINIGLNVVSKRDDGFHNLETFFYPLKSLYDVININKSDKFNYYEEKNLNINIDDNLIIKAHKKLENYFNKKLNVKIQFKKNIPIGAGLGGGSSDCAFTLLGLIKLFDLKISDTDLIKIALELGSDVPFFIYNKPAVGRSRGEILEFSEVKINYPFLIINPGIHISTKEAFQNIVSKLSNFNYNYFKNTSKIDFDYLKNNIENNFETYVYNKYPKVKSIKDNLYRLGARFAIMSGSGSTVYGIFENEQTAEKAIKYFPQNYFKLIVKN